VEEGSAAVGEGSTHEAPVAAAMEKTWATGSALLLLRGREHGSAGGEQRTPQRGKVRRQGEEADVAGRRRSSAGGGSWEPGEGRRLSVPQAGEEQGRSAGGAPALDGEERWGLAAAEEKGHPR
jgi:hypothetical protein